MTKTQFFISKKVGRAICDFKMLKDGDKIAVAVSGGKDSLSLLKILLDRRKITPIKYDVMAIHIDMGYGCIQPKRLEKLFKAYGCKHKIHDINILDTVGGDRSKVTCFWCSWNRRKNLFKLARRHKCTKLALGHHKDDIIETLLLNMFFQGKAKAMAPRQEMFEGKICIIRPLAYVEENELAKLAKELKFPIACCKCPNANNTKRDLVKEMIGQIRGICPNVKKNLFNCSDLRPYRRPKRRGSRKL